jgi:DNA modification methylase
MSVRILAGDCRAILPALPEASVHCVVTSPPYWGLRDYGVATWDGGDPVCNHRRTGTSTERVKAEGYADAFRNGTGRANHVEEPWPRGTCGACGARRIDQQLGLEATPEEYVARMVGVFRAVRRVLREDGTCWVNMGDSYANTLPRIAYGDQGTRGPGTQEGDRTVMRDWSCYGLAQKQLVGMPWRLAFALQADGWYLRADIIWAKPNPMPESVTDRPTKAHEYIFLLAKSARYFYDADAVREPAEYGRYPHATAWVRGTQNGDGHRSGGGGQRTKCPETGRNLRSVWTIPSAPFPEAHFATFPPALASRCIQAGTSEKGCCGACGAPWARQVDREPARVGAPYSTYGQGAGRRDGGRSQLVGSAARHLGWYPTCNCAAPVVPCTVLDPFGGSGTTGQVAEQLGRHSILIELSPAYVRMAEERTAQFGLFAQAVAG